MDIALAYNLPVVIHSRDAFEDTMKILEKYKNMKIYFHCW
jgi:Tat protein secretion system quality control protein TatD with DNase activity